MKKALLCGINYIGTSQALNGCINDIENISEILIENYGYSSNNICILTDNNSKSLPTKQNIISSLKNLIDNSNKYTEIYFHYSGHGSYVRDTNYDESDYRDECLIPCDYRQSGFIIDDEIKDIVKNIDNNCKLIMIIDACNSGTMVDLKYQCDCLSINYDFKLSYNSAYFKDDGNKNIISISGCKDDQTSADAYINNEFQGALTSTFIKVLKLGKYDVQLGELLQNIHYELQKNYYTQKPVLQSSKPIDLESKLFSCCV